MIGCFLLRALEQCISELRRVRVSETKSPVRLEASVVLLPLVLKVI